MWVCCIYITPLTKRSSPNYGRGRRGRDRMVVPITTDVVSSNLDQGEMYNIM